jgi:hypothetical protein
VILNIITAYYLEMPSDPKLKALASELNGKKWANVLMGKVKTPTKRKTIKKRNSPTRRNKAPSPPKRLSLNAMRAMHNAANLEKARNSYKLYKNAVKKDPKKVEDKYATYLTCLLLKLGNAPDSMIDDNCKRLLAAGKFTDYNTTLAGLKKEIKGKKYELFIKKLESQNDEDSKDLLEELKRVEKL